MINDFEFWHLPKDTLFRGAHTMLTATNVSPGSAVSGLILGQVGPFEGVIFAWRLLRNRLPTKDNIFRQGIVSLDSQL